MFATIRKELLIMLRDPAGLLLLLLMPIALTIVMTLVQDAPFKEFQNARVKILAVNEDKGNLGEKILNELQALEQFEIIRTIENDTLTAELLKNLLQKGDYKIGIILPPHTTLSLKNATNQLANEFAEILSLPQTLPTNNQYDSIPLLLYFDPVEKPAFRQALRFALQQYLSYIKIDLVLNSIARLNGNVDTFPFPQALMSVLQIEEEASHPEQLLSDRINSVQHNVPAWAIFGMFLIVVPFAGNTLKEIDEGSALRIQLIPHARIRVAVGKMSFYFLVCLFQFFIMMLIGIWFIPLLGLPALQIGSSLFALLIMAACIAYAAVGFGYLVAKMFKTPNQAMPFGAISIVLLSAIGGVWVPAEILPAVMQKVAMISPLYWSIQGINALFLRDLGVNGILIPCLILVIISSIFSILAMQMRKR